MALPKTTWRFGDRRGLFDRGRLRDLHEAQATAIHELSHEAVDALHIPNHFFGFLSLAHPSLLREA